MEGLNAVPPSADAEKPEVEVQEHKPKRSDRSAVLASAGTLGSSLEAISALLNETLEKAAPKDFAPSRRPFDRNEPAAGSVVISGTCFYHSSEDVSPSSDAGELIRDLVEAAALGALKDGGIPLIRRDSADNGEPSIEEDWILPKPLQQETGIITASGYPDLEALQRIQGRYETYKKIVDELVVVNQSGRLSPADRSDQIRIVAELMRELSADTGDGRDAYMTLEALGFDYGKLAAELEALGPVAHLRPGAACASEAMSLADDWIRTGRCRRVIIVCTLEAAGDGLNSLLDIHSDTSERPAALEGPNKQKRSAQLSAFSILIESEDAVSERGMRGIVELLGSETLPQTTGSTRHIIDHLSGGVERLVDGAEKRFVLYRAGMARHLVFLISESGDYGSEYPVEVAAFESVFGAAADQATITSTSALVKNGVGSVLGAAIAIKILESGHVPPAPVGWLEIPALDPYRFGNGSYTDPKYILYMAGLSRSRVAMNLFRLISREIVRVDDLSLYHRWVEGISGYEEVFVETGDRMLKLVGTQAVGRKPLPSPWRYGLGPTLLAPEEEPAPLVESEPLETPAAVQQEHAEPQDTAIELPPEAARFLEQGLDPEDVRILMVAAKYMGVALEALEIDKDLESDLGMSDQEHAELLIEICQEFEVPEYVNLNIGHYPTLVHMMTLVRSRRPELYLSKSKTERPVAAAGIPFPAVEGTLSRGELITLALEIVSNQTGYTVDMLRRSLDMVLDEELGIDAVEKKEVVQALCQTFQLEMPGSHQLIDFPTLSHILDYLLVNTIGDSLAEGAMTAETSLRLTASSIGDRLTRAAVEKGEGKPIEFAITDTVLMIAAEHSGIPSPALDVAANIVDDLGMDENRQGEIVSAVFDSFGIPQPQGLHASDFPSLGALIVFVRMSRPDLVDIKPVRMAQPPEPTKTADEPVGEADALAEPIPVVRCVASPDQLPPLIECFATGITLAGKRIVVMSDRGGASDELTNQLLEHGASVLPLAPTLPVEELKLRLQAWLEDGPVDGVYWLPALDSEPALIHLSRGVWRELNRQKVKNLHGAMRILYESINHKESFLITATRMGGLHGLGYSDVTSPLGGSVTGFAKAFKLEREGGNPKKREKLKTTQLGPVSDADVDGSLRRAGNYNGDSESSSPLVKVVDFEVDSDEWQIAQALIAETLADPETMEVGYVGGQRHGVTLVEVATPNGGPGTPLTEQSVFVITGAARRLTKEIISALSVNGGTFYLLDKAAAPDPDDPRIELLRTDKRALRELLVEEVQKTVPNPTASMIDRLVRFIERENRVLRAIETAEQNGAEAQYHSINMLDDRAVRNFIGEVIRRHGAIDFMVHAAGLKHSRTLLDKDPAEFDLVYDIRADGFYNLLRATDEAPPKCLVVFGTMETMRGSWGQCDSSAADELLRKLTGSLRWQQPETRGLAISWITAGTNGARIDRRRSGTRVGQLIDFSFIRREIESGSYRGEVIYQLNIPS